MTAAIALESVLTLRKYRAEPTKYSDSIYAYDTKGESPTSNTAPLSGAQVALWKGDITTLEVDAIVNAANNSLLGGGGVDGAIHRVAGPELKRECSQLNGCDTGDAKITSGYNLPSEYVIHTVGPVGEKPSLLHSCYTKCLDLAAERNIRSIAFPCISTGVYHYPNEPAANVALKVVSQFLEKETSVKTVVFCLFNEKDVEIYRRLIREYFPV